MNAAEKQRHDIKVRTASYGAASVAKEIADTTFENIKWEETVARLASEMKRGLLNPNFPESDREEVVNAALKKCMPMFRTHMSDLIRQAFNKLPRKNA